MNQLGKRIGILACVFMAFGLGACGGGNTETAKEDTNEYTYVASYPTVEEEIKNGNAFFLENGELFTYSYDQVEGTADFVQVVKKIKLEGDALSVGEKMTLKTGEDGANVQSFSFDNEGNIHGIVAKYPDSENVTDWDAYERSVQYFHCIFDATGEVASQKEFTATMQQMENSWIDCLFTNGEGNSVAFSGDSLMFFNKEGNFDGTGKMDGWASSYCKGSDGKIYVSYYSDSARGYVIGSVDFTSKSVVPTKISANGVQCMSAAGEGKLLLNVVDSFSLADIETGEKELLFNPIDCDLVAEQISNCAMLSDGSILIGTNDWNTGMMDYVVVRKLNAEEIISKKEIVVASVYTDSAINNFAVQFNKQSDTTKIVVKNYISNDAEWTENTYSDALTNLKNDLLSGKAGIDILALSTVDELSLDGKEELVFEDLKKYLGNSSELSLGDYFDAVIQNATVGDTLVYLPRTFYLNTLICKSKFVDGKSGWTMEDIAALAKQYPNSSILGKGMSKQYALYTFMTLYSDDFMDTENHTCNFTSDSFKQMLELCAAYPDDYDYDKMGSTAEALQNDQVLVYDGYINNWQDIQLNRAYFGQEEAAFIGYPNSMGVNGTVMQTSSGFAILQSSQEKDAAWEFVEFVSSRPYDRWNDYSFPARKSEYEKAKEEYLKQDYQLDENGDFLLDENGEKIPSGGSSSISDGTWTYEFHPVTEEEAAFADSLIEQSLPYQYTVSQEILSIITEEAAPFFQGTKTVDEVSQIIQSRIDIFLKENM